MKRWTRIEAFFLASFTGMTIFCLSLHAEENPAPALKLADQAVVVFLGDSITDGFRGNTNRFCDPGLGVGYVKMIANFLPALYPDKKIMIFNRGTSGNKIKDLQARWQKDCLELKPTWISIMIGVNDCYSFNSDDPEKKTKATSIDEYEKIYRDLLTSARESQARLVLMEPYLLPYAPNYPRLREDLDKRIEVIHRLAKEFDAILVPTDKIMTEAEGSRKERSFWTLGDGCHPQGPGCALIALSWLRAVGAL